MTGPWLFQRPEALSRSVNGELLLTSPSREDVDLLSETAGSVWRLLETPQTLDSLLDRLSVLYGVDAATIKDDVERLLRDLVARGWVEAVADADD